MAGQHLRLHHMSLSDSARFRPPPLPPAPGQPAPAPGQPAPAPGQPTPSPGQQPGKASSLGIQTQTEPLSKIPVEQLTSGQSQITYYDKEGKIIKSTLYEIDDKGEIVSK